MSDSCFELEGWDEFVERFLWKRVCRMQNHA